MRNPINPPVKVKQIDAINKLLTAAGITRDHRYEYSLPNLVPEFIAGLNDAIDQVVWIRRKRKNNAAVAIHPPTPDGKIKVDLYVREPRREWRKLKFSMVMPARAIVACLESVFDPKPVKL